MKLLPVYGLILFFIGGCRSRTVESKSLFTSLPADSTGIYFSNTLDESEHANVLMYQYFYNGGGVGVGDFNGDGLQDLYFTSNMGENKLYLNRGNFHFEDITAASGAGGRSRPWKTGVTVADVNGDGRPDIYLCYSGKVHGGNRINQLFINEGNDRDGIPHFSEQAARYGIADSCYSTQAYFFDMDRDGDLDMLLLTHNPFNLEIIEESFVRTTLAKPDANIGIKLFRNDGGFFHDITARSGISSTALTYGLSASISDINGDGYPDIYVCNDFGVPDYLYINDRNGGFVDRLQSSLGHISMFSMGSNIADINNDGLPDIFTLDMRPEDNHRQKLLFMSDNYDKFDLSVKDGFYYQYMRNMLQLNNGDGTFSEIGQLAGVSGTDWSWAPLLADFDNDGWKDLFVSNGFLRDYTNLDFIMYLSKYLQVKGKIKSEDILGLVHNMPSSHVSSYFFKNDGGLTFADSSREWGIGMPSNSNGAVYADLDNDGDLDLIVNNVNAPAFVYRNNESERGGGSYLEVKLNGEGGNVDGIGAKVTIWCGGKMQLVEQMPARGFQSSVTPVLHFGLGKDTVVDSLRVVWQSGRTQVLYHISAEQTFKLHERDAVTKGVSEEGAVPTIFEKVQSPMAGGNAVNRINDFKRQPLLVSSLSFFGPCMAKADVNGDGLEDVYVGGGSGKAGSLYIQQQDGSFRIKAQPAFEGDRQCEDADAVFFDADGDGDKDLYVVSGGYHNYGVDDSLLQDRLYINDGKGNFRKNRAALPKMLVGKSCVRVADVNGDGFPDLFVGGRVKPGRYPETPESFLLINDGEGYFDDRTDMLAPALKSTGMVTDACWVDLNRDGKDDLIVVGEWMPVSIYINHNGRLEDSTSRYFDKPYSGWWNRLSISDLNKDGRPDLVIGNFGLNGQCRASAKEPVEMYYSDFDGDGRVDPIFCFYIQGKSYPFVSRDEMLRQLNYLRKRYPDYKSYADATYEDMFTVEERKGAKHLQADCLETSFFEMGADRKFHKKSLPMEAQFSPVFTITPMDYDRDGNMDLLLCGNINHARLRLGKFDANYGVLLHGDGRGNFKYVDQARSGFKLRGDVRSVIEMPGNEWLFGVNQAAVEAYKLR